VNAASEPFCMDSTAPAPADTSTVEHCSLDTCVSSDRNMAQLRVCLGP
jgi:hypothetical protein